MCVHCVCPHLMAHIFPLPQVMQIAGVSKDKFAFIVQSMAPCMASFVPISRYIPRADLPVALAPNLPPILLVVPPPLLILSSSSSSSPYSWVGAQIGYVSSGFSASACKQSQDPFVIVAETLRMSPVDKLWCGNMPSCLVSSSCHTTSVSVPARANGCVCDPGLCPLPGLWVHVDC